MVLVSIKGQPPVEVTSKVRRVFEMAARDEHVNDATLSSLSAHETNQLALLAAFEQGARVNNLTTFDSRGKKLARGDRVSAIAPSGSLNMRVDQRNNPNMVVSSSPNSVAGYVSTVLYGTVDIRKQQPEPDVTRVRNNAVIDRRGTRGQHMISSVAAIARNRGTAPSFRDDPPSADHRLPADRVWVERMIAHADQLKRSGVDASIDPVHEMNSLRRSIRESLGPRGP